MDQASASPVASCAHNPAAPRTLPSWLPSEGQARTVVPSRDGSAPQSVPHSEPVHIVPRPSSPALCQSDAKGYLLPDYYSGATGTTLETAAIRCFPLSLVKTENSNPKDFGIRACYP